MCPKCGKEMRKGYLFGSKDGAFSFANEVPDSFENAKNADGFVKLTELKVDGRTSVEACRSYGVCAAVALGVMLVGAVGMKLVPPQYFGVVERFSVFAATGFNAALGIHLFRGKNAGETQNDQEEKP